VFVVLKGPRRGLPLSAEGVDEILDGARRRAGLEHATCHELRHTCLTRFREAGIALEVVQAQAGHRSLESTRIYLHLTNDWLAEQYRRAAALIDADAPSIGELVVARTVQGLGAAVVMPLSLTILRTAFPPARRGLIVGIYGGLAGLAVAAGSIVGGLVAERLDWHWIFWLNVPIGLVALALGARLLPESHGAPERLDPVGVGLVSVGVVSLVWALIRANDIGWSSPEIVATLLAAGALLLAFVGWEQRVAEPMVPMRLFRNPAFAVGNVTTFLMSGATFAAAFLITQEFQFARGYSPISTGVRLLPFFATPMVVSPLAGALSDRIGRRPIMLTGLALKASGYAWVAAHGSLATSWVEIVTGLLVAGVGISMALPTVPTTVLNAVTKHEMGKASGINYMAQRFGAVFSIAIASAVFAAHGHLGNPAAVTAGFRPALWACVIFAVLAALTAVAITGRPSVAPTESPAADVLVGASVPKGHECPTSCSGSASTLRPSGYTRLIATTDGIARGWTGTPTAGRKSMLAAPSWTA
jgi:MFS family permease